MRDDGDRYYVENVPELLAYFQRYRADHGRDLTMVLMGQPHIPLPEDEDVVPIGFVSDRMDRGTVLEILAIGTVLLATGMWVVGELLPFLLPVLGAIFGGLALSMYPVASAYVTDRVPADRLVQASATLLFAYGAGATLGPLGGAAAMSVLGPSALWLFCALAAAVLAMGMPWRRRMRRREIEAQSHFVMVTPRASTVIADASSQPS